MRKSVSTILVLLGALALAGQPSRADSGPTPDIASRVDAYMTAAVINDRFMGNVLIARNGMPVVERSYGMANQEWAIANQPDTVFRIGSVTKQFTAMAIMQLQERGALKVSDSICRHISPCPEAWRPVTLRHLLTHTSGIPSYTRLPEWNERISQLPQTHSSLVAQFRDLPLEFTPGEKSRYDNSGYFLLGLVIERASGEPYAQFLQKNIFAPLGMTHTGYDRQRQLIPRRANGYHWSGNGFINAPIINVDLAYAAGALVSTTHDLLRWDQALNTTNLVSRRSLDEMFTPVRDDYGYGWRIDTAFGRPQISHGGSIHGFSAYISRFPADRLTVIVLSNSVDASATRVAKNLAAIAFGEPATPAPPQLPDLLWTTIQKQGVTAAVAQYRALRRAPTAAYDLGEDGLNGLGYDLIKNERVPDAVAIFKLATDTFPTSANAHDSLAEAYRANGQNDLSIAHYEKSLSLDPKNENAARMLAELRAESGAGSRH
jgi:CubicO group peptidase (beta-lactamase class C family)